MQPSSRQGTPQSGCKACPLAGRVTCLAAVALLAMSMASAQPLDPGTRGTSDFQGVWYTADPADPGLKPDATIVVGGEVRAHDATPLVTGEAAMSIATVGQPFETKLLEAPDALVGGVLEPPDGAAVDPVSGWLEPPEVEGIAYDETAYGGSGGFVNLTEETTKAFWVAHAEMIPGKVGTLFAMEAGFVNVTWTMQSGPPQDMQYLISYRPVHTPMAIYHTHGVDAVTPTGAPAVSLPGGNGYRLHFSQDIPWGTDPLPHIHTDDTLWLETLGQGRELRARVNEGRAALEINTIDPPSDPMHFVGVQVVEVRPKDPDSLPPVVTEFKLGDRMWPTKPDIPQDDAVAYVAKGGAGTGDYVYQHVAPQGEDWLMEGGVFAVKETVQTNNVEVFWQRLSDVPAIAALDILWPYEFARFDLDWPGDEGMQIFVRAPLHQLETAAMLNESLNPSLMPYFTSEGGTPQPLTVDKAFYTTGGCKALLRYRPGSPEGAGGVMFQPVHAYDHFHPRFDDPVLDAPIGQTITSAYHEPADLPGYIYVATGPGANPRDDVYDWEIYDGDNTVDPIIPDDVTGQIIPVNTGNLEVWWYNIDAHGVAWPSWVNQYDADWPTVPDGEIVIASTCGSGPLDAALHPSREIYAQNTRSMPGFNPNEEHAMRYNPNLIGACGTPKTWDDEKAGFAVYALRDDLNAIDNDSEPYALLRYKNPEDSTEWQYKVYSVAAEDATFTLSYDRFAGQVLLPPYPLSEDPTPFPACEESTPVSGPWFEDVKGQIYAKAAGNAGPLATAQVVAKYYYQVYNKLPANRGYYDPSTDSEFPAGAHIPWLSRRSSPNTQPEPVTFVISWPDVPHLKYNEVLVEAKSGGLPGLYDPASGAGVPVEVIYEQSNANGTGDSVTLIDWGVARESTDKVPNLPESVETNIDLSSGLYMFTELGPDLRGRLRYVDSGVNKGMLLLTGKYGSIGNTQFILLNVLTEMEKEELLALSKSDADPNHGAFVAAVNSLAANASEVFEITGGADPDVHTAWGLSTGFADAPGYFTIATNNVEGTTLPISLYVIEVKEELFAGDLKVTYPTCVFSEVLDLKHTGDFVGHPERYRFQWLVQPATDTVPLVPTSPEDLIASDWQWYRDEYRQRPASAQPPAEVGMPGVPGAMAERVEGGNVFALSDNYFTCRYAPYVEGVAPDEADWSDWTAPQLAEGWIKRVVGEINPFTQRASGGFIAGAEREYFRFHEDEVNTIVSMLEQAGPRYEGNVALNCDNLNDLKLIPTYGTVFDRGKDLSIEAAEPIDFPPANNALLLVSSRLADLYVLLGNEAYGDATDPTIGFGTTTGQYASEAATSIYCFMNQTASLLEEELILLRGRDDTMLPGTDEAPIYNRFFPNFSTDFTGGQVAYFLNYGIRDVTGNGSADVNDAVQMYPQGHGDAWGHYLSATKQYYGLFAHPDYTYMPRAETVLIGAQPVSVDFFDERKFAQAAAAKARTGAEIVDLTYRLRYSADPNNQFQGYKDNDPERAWGLSEWARRAGQGAYFDWIAGNALLPVEDPERPNDIRKIDRSSVLELREIAGAFTDIQAQFDEANLGVNPLGLAAGVVPFDIDPSQVDSGKTHFEQIYDRAVKAMLNAITVFNHANESSQRLRQQQDQAADFQVNVVEREADFNARLIEIYGYPYANDIGPGKLYPPGYDGPDLYHYDYFYPQEVLGLDPGEVQQIDIEVPSIQDPDAIILPDGSVTGDTSLVTYHVSVDGYGNVIPPGEDWGQRRAPGELQLARQDLFQAIARYSRAIDDYSGFLYQIEDKLALLEAQQNLNAAEITILNNQAARAQTLNNYISSARKRQFGYRTAARLATRVANATAEALPRILVAGFSVGGDYTSVVRGVIKGIAAIAEEALTIAGDAEDLAILDRENAEQELQQSENIQLTTAQQGYAIQQSLGELRNLLLNDTTLRYEIYNTQEAMLQQVGRYRAAVARGQRLLESLLRYRRQTAAQVEQMRYRDMAFRIFRNDALQKYRAQFDLAGRYVYLAAQAYDYETNLLRTDSRGGQQFMEGIIRSRSLGLIQNGLPVTGGLYGDPGLADPMARMLQNWEEVLEGQLGFNNPQTETNRFSLRSELFRIAPGRDGNAVWRETLERHIVEDLLTLPEFKRYCRLFDNPQPTEPGIVIPFSTTITFGQNFFGWPLGGGDSAYDPTNFATKVRSVGVWFSNYNNLGSGISNTPRVYLIPTGSDIMRSPTEGPNELRHWKIIDQKLPPPFTLGANDFDDPGWIPMVDSLSDEYGDIRKFSMFRAYHDSGNFSTSEVISSSRLIGRSVANTEWLLIIPAGTLSSDRDEALERFIYGQLLQDGTRDNNGVSDIKLFFQTYAISGN